ncbi:MAG: ABC transporter permease [Saprospiraceae bacterium]
MNQFLAFLRKEFNHVIRDRRTLLVLIGMPIIQILLFGFALSNEVKNTTVTVFDQAKDLHSQQLIAKVNSSAYFDIVNTIRDQKQIDEELRSGDSKMVLVIPSNFGSDLGHQNKAQVQVVLDGINPNLSTTLTNYISAIVYDYQTDLKGQKELPYKINVVTRMLYNPQLKGEYTFVPGVIALVLMLICTMMTAISISKEKEMGNMEILLVSPLKPVLFILSKAALYLILSLIILTIILLMSVYILNVPIQGSLGLIYFISLLFILASLALGLTISTFTDSQQSAMMISLIGLMLPTMMLSGFMFPIESMPLPLRNFSNLIPAKWFFYSMQAVMIKGLGIKYILKEVIILTVYSIVFFTISFTKFKIRL